MPKHHNGKPLRFAALIRVSTEKQEKQGESLRTQRKQIETAATQVGGTIVRSFAGQEHATPGWERQQRDQMLAEAEKKPRPFDAVIVAHEDRWSRDDTSSSKDLERLKVAGVRFFVLDREQDLADPTARLYLGMSAVIGAYHARNQSKKSIENRIERAQRGIPTAGRKPPGRVFDRETAEWGIDPHQKALYQEIADRYLAGEPLPKLAKERGMSLSSLGETLRNRCGDTWTLKFQVDDLNIRETIAVNVPRLLPEKTIQAIRQRMEANRTYLHRPPKSKHAYLLAGRIFCAACGYALTGQAARPSGRLYYRHPHQERERPCPLKNPKPWVPAHEIEEAVVGNLFDMFGSPAAIERAVKAAVPDCDKLLKQRQRIESELAKLDRARNRVLDLIDRDTITDAQADKKLRDLKDREASLRAELDKLVAALADVPDEKAIRSYVQQVGEAIIVYDDNGDNHEGGNDLGTFLNMTEADRRKLIESALSGRDGAGKPAGVYVRQVGDTGPHRPKKWDFKLRGRLVMRDVGR